MKTKTWTIKLTFTYSPKTNEKRLLFKNLGEYCSSMIICFHAAQCIILLKLKDSADLEDYKLAKNIAISVGVLTSNIISWKYNVGFSDIKILKGNKHKMKYDPNSFINCKKTYKPLLDIDLTEKNLSILTAFNEIKSESNLPLRFLMYYRLLECFSKKDFKQDIDKLIKKHNPKVVFIKSNRNPKEKISLIRHFRNKIHPTKPTYRFPYTSLKRGLKEIEITVRTIISYIFKLTP